MVIRYPSLTLKTTRQLVTPGSAWPWPCKVLPRQHLIMILVGRILYPSITLCLIHFVTIQVRWWMSLFRNVPFTMQSGRSLFLPQYIPLVCWNCTWTFTLLMSKYWVNNFNPLSIVSNWEIVVGIYNIRFHDGYEHFGHEMKSLSKFTLAVHDLK